jgi:hypothetical protein
MSATFVRLEVPSPGPDQPQDPLGPDVPAPNDPADPPPDGPDAPYEPQEDPTPIDPSPPGPEINPPADRRGLEVEARFPPAGATGGQMWRRPAGNGNAG